MTNYQVPFSMSLADIIIDANAIDLVEGEDYEVLN